ncbi:MAG TPA: glutaredoxin family protein [Spirochaetota bacterium]|nr:glutaredoxin family protein [Spirochaetota bacterium]
MALMNRVEGKGKGTIVLYALSTCVWCKKARGLLDELGVAYEYVYVDQLPREANAAVKDEIRRWNPQGSFPTIVIDNDRCIVGFDEEKIMKEIGL